MTPIQVNQNFGANNDQLKTGGSNFLGREVVLKTYTTFGN